MSGWSPNPQHWTVPSLLLDQPLVLKGTLSKPTTYGRVSHAHRREHGWPNPH